MKKRINALLCAAAVVISVIGGTGCTANKGETSKGSTAGESQSASTVDDGSAANGTTALKPTATVDEKALAAALKYDLKPVKKDAFLKGKQEKGDDVYDYWRKLFNIIDGDTYTGEHSSGDYLVLNNLTFMQGSNTGTPMQAETKPLSSFDFASGCSFEVKNNEPVDVGEKIYSVADLPYKKWGNTYYIFDSFVVDGDIQQHKYYSWEDPAGEGSWAHESYISDTGLLTVEEIKSDLSEEEFLKEYRVVANTECRERMATDKVTLEIGGIEEIDDGGHKYSKVTINYKKTVAEPLMLSYEFFFTHPGYNDELEYTSIGDAYLTLLSNEGSFTVTTYEGIQDKDIMWSATYADDEFLKDLGNNSNLKAPDVTIRGYKTGYINNDKKLDKVINKGNQNYAYMCTFNEDFKGKVYAIAQRFGTGIAEESHDYIDVKAGETLFFNFTSLQVWSYSNSLADTHIYFIPDGETATPAKADAYEKPHSIVLNIPLFYDDFIPTFGGVMTQEAIAGRYESIDAFNKECKSPVVYYIVKDNGEYYVHTEYASLKKGEDGQYYLSTIPFIFNSEGTELCSFYMTYGY